MWIFFENNIYVLVVTHQYTFKFPVGSSTCSATRAIDVPFEIACDKNNHIPNRNFFLNYNYNKLLCIYIMYHNILFICINALHI